MTKTKIAITTLAITAILVVLHSFTYKTVNIVDYLYMPRSGQTYIPPTVTGVSIDPTELNTNISVNWTSGFNSRHRQGDYLMGIEFDQSQQSLQTAVNHIYRFYTTPSSAGTLPDDGQSISGITIFRLATAR